ncbi:MAG TPA: undecaprenyl-diphosphate phosphatase [Gemmatimonadaceae bacterium]|nr:undecaprenyl-diphosphate phosphatase [Gemmatimonadaceae bacterium]
MSVFQAFVLGIIQGLAEFLPISSSAHLALTPWLLGWPEAGLAFDTSLHLGTLAAVLWYFQEEWRRLAASAWELARTRQVTTESHRRVIFLIIATIPGGIAGLLLEDLAESIFRAPVVTGIALIALGLLLWAVDRWAAHARPLGTMQWRDALLFGLAQVVALVPGVSRSGATMTMGRGLRFTREGAAVFSFLMSMPITFAAVAVKLPEAIRERDVILPLIVGVVASGASGWLAISVLLKYVTRHSFGVFAVYRVILGAFVLILLAIRE